MKKVNLIVATITFCIISGVVIAQVIVQPGKSNSTSIKQKIDVAPRKFVDRDPLDVLVNENEFEGSVAYLSIDAPQKNNRSVPFYLVNRNKKNLNLHKITPNTADIIFDPQISPDGKYTLVKAGWPYDYHGTYDLLIINNQTGESTRGAKDLSYGVTKWSPDSSRILYFSGGGITGVSQTSGETQLSFFDLKSKKATQVSKGIEGLCSSWSEDGKIIYLEKLSEPDKDGLSYGVYSYDPSSIKKSLIVANAYFPARASDRVVFSKPQQYSNGKNLLYVCLVKSKVDDKEGVSTKLCLYDIDSKSSRYIDSFTATDDISYYCTNDDNRIIIMRYTYARNQGNEGEGIAYINVINVDSLKIIKTSSLKASDIKPVRRLRSDRQVEIVYISPDGKYIYFRIKKIIGTGESLLDVLYSINKLSVEDGSHVEILNLKNIQGGSPGLSWIKSANN